MNVSPIDLPNTVDFIELPHFEKFLEAQFGDVQPLTDQDTSLVRTPH